MFDFKGHYHMFAEWKPVKASVAHRSVFKAEFLSVSINGTCSNLLTNAKLFADDTALFSEANNASEIFENLANDLCIASE